MVERLVVDRTVLTGACESKYGGGPCEGEKLIYFGLFFQRFPRCIIFSPLWRRFKRCTDHKIHFACHGRHIGRTRGHSCVVCGPQSVNFWHHCRNKMVVGVQVNLAERFQLGFEKFGSWTLTNSIWLTTVVDSTARNALLASKYGGSVCVGGYEGT